MAILKRENVIINEDDKGRIKELEAMGYKQVSKEDLKPKKQQKSEKASSK